MNITIHDYNKHILEDVLCLVKIWHPEISEAQRTSDPKRLVKKLIRDRSVILKYPSISLEVDMPLFLMYDCKCIFCLDIEKEPFRFSPDDICFECDENFTDKEDVLMQSLFRKVKSIIKEGNMTEWNKIKYFLPVSTIIKNRLVLNYLQLFKFFAWDRNTTNTKILTLKILLLEKLNVIDPIFFTKQNVEIFIANEEKQ